MPQHVSARNFGNINKRSCELQNIKQKLKLNELIFDCYQFVYNFLLLCFAFWQKTFKWRTQCLHWFMIHSVSVNVRIFKRSTFRSICFYLLQSGQVPVGYDALLFVDSFACFFFVLSMNSKVNKTKRRKKTHQNIFYKISKSIFLFFPHF